MTEQFDEFERELSKLRPAELSRHVEQQIAGELDEPSMRFADRVLLTFMGSGALAAAVIVGLVSWQVLQAPAPEMPAAQTIAASPPASLAQYQLMLARGERSAAEIVR